ncbi:MAG: DUF4494 domain-containing protein [Prevotella sp.]|nr:DUF4494 domain-containing protein [Prevotella sp.]
MRSKTAQWFETKVQYEKVQVDGTQKKVTEQYVVDSLSFTEAESSIIEEMKPYVSGDYKIKNITPANYHEVFFSDDTQDDKWYKVKLTFITIDEKTEKEKHSIVHYLVQARSTGTAQQAINDVMSKSMIDYETVSISETKIIDVFERSAGKSNNGSSKSSSEPIDEYE